MGKKWQGTEKQKARDPCEEEDRAEGGNNVRKQQWYTDLLDGSGQVQAKLNDFVLGYWEICDPCKWSPRKQQMFF